MNISVDAPTLVSIVAPVDVVPLSNTNIADTPVHGVHATEHGHIEPNAVVASPLARKLGSNKSVRHSKAAKTLAPGPSVVHPMPCPPDA